MMYVILKNDVFALGYGYSSKLLNLIGFGNNGDSMKNY